MNKDAEVIQESSNVVRILKGSLFAIITTLVALFIYSLILTFTNIPEQTMTACIIIITCISILIGSSLSTMRIKKIGILNGGLVGLIYISIIYLFSSVLQTGFSLNLSSIIIMAGGIIAGMIRRNYRSELIKVRE